MIRFTATLEKFGQQGEKTGWTYIVVPAALAEQLKPGNRKSFRVQGKLDACRIERVALIPMGEGDFIMAVNAIMRKEIRKNVGATIKIELAIDNTEIKPPAALIECLKDEPAAWAQYQSIAPSHQLYFTRWIESAKTEGTKAKRIAQTVTALAAGKDYGAMLRSLKERRDEDFH
ncbi:MAG TPA: YdeI/OmpD-associated family protein [Flavisolibacter sp.]|nr:YdeI/OmpD-associated family protein [Flavisolibacter sp.]